VQNPSYFGRGGTAPAASQDADASKATESLCSPGIAFAFGLIPGVGAICNAEYLKAFVHVMIFGFLISLIASSNIGSFQPLFVAMMIAFYWYMPLEAYHTAKFRALAAGGFHIERRMGSQRQESLWTGVILTFMGALLFLNELLHGFLERALKFWPVVLIGYGIFKIWEHFGTEKPLEAVEK
jgi:hypothetical protein